MSITSVRSRPAFPSLDPFSWPGDFARIPDEEWTRQPVDQFGLNYDDVGSHGWYKNLEPTISQVLATLSPGDLLIDYSSGTGILTRRLVDSISYPVGILNVDASPKFLRVALESFRHDERVGFRLLRWLKEEKRLQSLDEVAGSGLLDRGADAITATNAIHLYYDLDETLASWALDDAALMSRHAKLREKVFVPVPSSSTSRRSGTPASACSTSSRRPSSPASTSGTAC